MIPCDIHDYIEIACLYKLPIELNLKDGSALQGVASDIKSAEGQEYLVITSVTPELENASNKTDQIALIHIERMTALISNPHFDVIDFKNPG